MSFRPALPLGGYAGWAFLKRTGAAQRAAFDRTPEIARDEAHFRAKIGTVRTAEDLVSDRRLLKVALGAFGLDADLGNRAFIRKVLEEGTLDPKSLANRLADKQYAAFSRAFGFGDYSVPRTQLSDFADGILAAYRTRGFEAAVGAQDGSLRLAMNAEREVGALAARAMSDDAKWFTVMGNRPMRQVFETALRLPASFGTLDIDRQLQTLRARTAAAFGNGEVAQFSDPAKLEALVRRYLVMADLGRGSAGPAMSWAAGALALLQAGRVS